MEIVRQLVNDCTYKKSVVSGINPIGKLWDFTKRNIRIQAFIQGRTVIALGDELDSECNRPLTGTDHTRLRPLNDILEWLAGLVLPSYLQR